MQGHPRPSPGKEVTAQEARDRLAGLRRSKLVGPAVREAFESLYHQAGYRAGTILVTRGGLAKEFGVERRAAWGWIDKLVEANLVGIIGEDDRSGQVHLEVFDPNETIFRTRLEADRQQVLFATHEDQPDEGAPLIPLVQPHEAGRDTRASLPQRESYARISPAAGELRAQLSRPDATPPWEPGGETPRAPAPARAFDETYDLSTTSIEPKGGDLRLTIDGLCGRLWPAGRKTIDCPPDLRALYWFATLLNSPEHRPWAEHLLDIATLKRRRGEKRIGNAFAYLQGCLQKQQSWIVGTFVPAEFVQPLAVPGPANTAPADPPPTPAPPEGPEDEEFKRLRNEFLRTMSFSQACAKARAQLARQTIVEPVGPQPPKPR